MSDNEEPDYLTWSPSKPAEPEVDPQPVYREPEAPMVEPVASDPVISRDEDHVPEAQAEEEPVAVLAVEDTDVDERDTFETPSDWMQPAPLDTAPVVDEPIVERSEPEEIVVPPSTDIDAVIEATAADEDEEGDEDEIVFDLLSLSTEERRHLSMRLTGAGIAHVWEVATDLVVSVKDAPAIEHYIEEVQNPQGFADEELVEFSEDEDVDDEAIYAAMSGLYVSADKLMQKPNDPGNRTAFYDATDDIDGLPAPFGFDPRVWAQVQELANSIADLMDADGDESAIANDARTLRQLLVNYV